jgi:L-rhamnose isomerase
MKEADNSTPSIAECVKSAFALAHTAERLRSDLATHLSRISPGRDQAVIHSFYVRLGDLVSAFGLLEDKLAEWRSLGRYQL